MGKSKEVNSWELEDDVNEGAPKTMYMGFIRVTVENILKNPKVIEKLGTNTFTYDEKYIQAFLDRYKEDSIEYAYILHKEDTNENGETEKAHYHICIRNINGSNFGFDVLKSAFPVGKIERGRTWQYMLQYLLHKNAPEKTQHTIEEIITNIDGGTLDLYLKSTPSVKKRSALERNFDKLKDDIINYRILQYQFREQLGKNTLYRKLMAEFDTKIEKAFAAQRAGLYEEYKHTRSLEVIFIEGGGGCGKTALAMAYCQQRKWSYYIASDENDPMQDYASQQCLILDELRDDSFSYSSFMRLLNTYTGTTVQSRYYNKAFTGEAIIIPSYVPLNEYYKPDVKKKKKYVADENYYGDNALVQLHRRIKTLVRAERDLFYVYDHKKDGSNVLREKIPNPAYLIKPEEDKSHVSTEDFVGASEIFAQTLIESGKVDAEEYKLFKAYMNERLNTPNDVLFNANGAPITFEDYKAYHNAKELAGGELLDSEGKRIELKDFVREDRIVPALPEHDITLNFTEDDMRVTQYFERCMLKELQDKVAILQKAIEILRTDKTA